MVSAQTPAGSFRLNFFGLEKNHPVWQMTPTQAPRGCHHLGTGFPDGSGKHSHVEDGLRVASQKSSCSAWCTWRNFHDATTGYENTQGYNQALNQKTVHRERSSRPIRWSPGTCCSKELGTRLDSSATIKTYHLLRKTKSNQIKLNLKPPIFKLWTCLLQQQKIQKNGSSIGHWSQIWDESFAQIWSSNAQRTRWRSSSFLCFTWRPKTGQNTPQQNWISQKKNVLFEVGTSQTFENWGNLRVGTCGR